MFNDVILKSKALNLSNLSAVFNKIPNTKGAILLSHNSRGNKDNPVLVELEKNLNRELYSTLRYNFHYVDKLPVENAVWEDLVSDFDASYSYLIDKEIVPNVYLIGQSMGGAVAVEYAIRNNLRCPIIILGFYEPMFAKYITEQRLKDLKSPVLVLHGEKDEYASIQAVRTFLGRNRLNFELFEISGATHVLDSADEGVRSTSDIHQEVLAKINGFMLKTSIS